VLQREVSPLGFLMRDLVDRMQDEGDRSRQALEDAARKWPSDTYALSSPLSEAPHKHRRALLALVAVTAAVLYTRIIPVGLSVAGSKFVAFEQHRLLLLLAGEAVVI
jgi:hypothetical protein